MTERIILVGAADVASAGFAMSSAADALRRVAMSIDGSVDRMERIVDRLEQALARHAERLEAIHGK